MPKQKDQKHKPVLLSHVLNLLDPQAGETYLDLTAGYGGHAEAVSTLIGEDGQMILVDRDEFAIDELSRRFGRHGQILHMDFESAAEELLEQSWQVDLILMDLGVSSPQLEMAERGFSLTREGPLDMRMDQRQVLTAARIVNSYSEQELADLIYRYGEERMSRRIARAIVAARPLETTVELAAVVARAMGGARSRIHPATRTFQALRIAVNDELGRLERTLPKALRLLKPKGRLAVVSFHSLEDRIVKNFIREHSRGDDAELLNLTKKVIQGRAEDVTNPRARSAKLRAAMKIKTKKEVDT